MMERQCIRCGKNVPDTATYCPFCGIIVDSSEPLGEQTEEFVAQPEPMAEYYEPNTDANKGLKLVAIILSVVAALMVFGIGWYILSRNNDTQVSEDVNRECSSSASISESPDMRAPDIIVNSDGFYTVDNCPTSYSQLEVKPTTGEMGVVKSVDVYKDGSFLQTIIFDEDALPSQKTVHFLDANFDGLVDIFVGPVSNRQTSGLLLWDSGNGRFIIAGIKTEGYGVVYDFNGDFSFNPERRLVMSSGIISGFESICDKMVWNDNTLVGREQLITVMLASRYSDHNVSARYTIRDISSGKTICSTNNPKSLPSEWNKWIWEPTAEDESRFAEIDHDTDNYSYSSSSSSASNSSSPSSVPSWLEGNWKYVTYIRGNRNECRVGISGNYIIVMTNGNLDYSGTFTISGNELTYRMNGYGCYFVLDFANQRLMVDESHPMQRF